MLVCLAVLFSSLVSASMEIKPQAIRLAPAVSVRNVVDPFDYFSNSWAVIGLKDYSDATRISPDGEFFLAGKSSFQVLVGEELVPLDGRVKKTLVKGYLPIVRYDFVVNERVEYILEFFACPLESGGDAAYAWPDSPNFLNLARLTFRNLGPMPEKAVVGLAWKGGPADLSARDLNGANEWAVSSGNSLLSVL